MSNLLERLKSSFFFLILIIGTLAIPQLFILHQIIFALFGATAICEIYFAHKNPQRTIGPNEARATDVVLVEELAIIIFGTIAYCGFERQQIIAIQIGVIACDTMAYVIGKLIGHKLISAKPFPNVSPNKSFEGTIGGVICSGLILWAWFSWQSNALMTTRWTKIAIFTIGTLTVIGDLAGSFIKRRLDIKDSNECAVHYPLLRYLGWPMAGFGGCLDRFDSVYFVSLMLSPLTMP
ncbi:phosphatidate cytidylyltransferase [Candidatus Saccharibacteria bacterium]|nr:phosphatidate cytidylyltransferase [Candidatus Saccharibacteria bacterium]